MLPTMTERAYSCYGRICRAASRHRGLSWDHLRSARDLATELCAPAPDPNRVSSLTGILGLTPADLEAVTPGPDPVPLEVA